MPIPTLPSFVLVSLDSYSEKPDYGLQRSPMDGGIPKQRAMRSIPIITRSVTLLIVDSGNRDVFDRWFAGELYGGATWFTM
ncbi:hypothetical protein ACPRNU_23795, partial [Chromobacterium vaccinii]|uniref:hypothetical protein n=1 Tax=Chromobacterium vaccinii TaxID=1108595 RepID=UPI003C72FBC8